MFIKQCIVLKKLIRRKSFQYITKNPQLLNFDVSIIGGGIGGFSTAARLQSRGLKTCVIEAHSTLGGSAGYYERNGFSFDVGATTFVDFEHGGVGHDLLQEIGLQSIPNAEVLQGYKMHLPN